MSCRLTKLCFKLFQQKAKASCFCVRRRHQKLHLLQWRQLHRARALLRLSTRLHRAPVGNKTNTYCHHVRLWNYCKLQQLIYEVANDVTSQITKSQSAEAFVRKSLQRFQTSSDMNIGTKSACKIPPARASMAEQLLCSFFDPCSVSRHA